MSAPSSSPPPSPRPLAVNGQIVVESRRYSGWVDPRYPIGYWQAALAVGGDATGGALGIDLVFQSALTGFLNSQMYSVERFSIFTADSTDRTMKISAPNMGGPSNFGFVHEYLVLVEDISGASGTSLRAESQALLPWFLGSQRTAAVTASLSLLTDNTDGVTFTFEAEGYRWSSRSVLVDGGPQRPPTGPYRQ